jgi:hypothetical protein
MSSIWTYYSVPLTAETELCMHASPRSLIVEATKRSLNRDIDIHDAGYDSHGQVDAEDMSVMV